MLRKSKIFFSSVKVHSVSVSTLVGINKTSESQKNERRTKVYPLQRSTNENPSTPRDRESRLGTPSVNPGGVLYDFEEQNPQTNCNKVRRHPVSTTRHENNEKSFRYLITEGFVKTVNSRILGSHRRRF